MPKSYGKIAVLRCGEGGEVGTGDCLFVAVFADSYDELVAAAAHWNLARLSGDPNKI